MCGLKFLLIFLAFLVSTCLAISTVTNDGKYKTRRTPLHKVLLTQKGYIQFLRWELPVPELREFTFCLWLESNDLTHPHSIFSYSKNERDRLVRAWIASKGKSVHLEIGGNVVFETRTDIRENRWYHVCQSWENQAGRYALWIDGRLKVQGQSAETMGHVIPSGGDIVLGQEYTDFDKGLEEGIEGAVLGFNLLLASSFTPASSFEEASHDSAPRFVGSSYETVPFVARVPMKIMRHDIDYQPRLPFAFPVFRSIREKRSSGNANPAGNSTRLERGIPQRRPPTSQEVIENVFESRKMRKIAREPLGLQLVKQSYVQCEIGRGSPYVGGSSMLISWSRTPVRIFGGATVKNVAGSCGKF